MFDGSVRRAPWALRHCKSPVHTGVQCHLFNRQSFMVAVQGSTHCIECDLSAGDLVQLPPSAKPPSKPFKCDRRPKPTTQKSPPTSNPLPRKHVVAAVRCRKIPQSIRHRIIYGLISFNIDEPEAPHKTLYLQQYSPKK